MDNFKLLVVADDLTGANDTSVSFANQGYNTLLLMEKAEVNNLDNNAEVFAVSSDSRASGSSACAITKQIITTAINQQVSNLYLKIDSTMRGSVSYQIQGALEAWQQKYNDAVAIICSAYPAMGRTIINGRLYVDGIEVDKTATARDPICPVNTCEIQQLLPSAKVITNCNNATDLVNKILKLRQQNPQINQIAIDAKTTNDLVIIAKAISILGNKAIPVGSAGLSQQITKFLPNLGQVQQKIELPITGRILIVVTSVHDTSQSQVDYYIGKESGGNAIVISPHPAQMLTKSSLPALIEQVKALAKSGDGTVIIRANTAKIDNPNLSKEQLAKKFANQLSLLAKSILEQENFGAILLVGGDGANATLQAIGAKQLSIIYPISEGVPIAKICGNQFTGLPVITKSGGFGEVDLIAKIINLLTESNP